MIPIQNKSSQLTFLECAAVGVTVLFASSPRILRHFPNASRQGFFLCGGALMVSSFLYNHFRYGPHLSHSQQTLEKGVLFSAVSLSTSLILRELPLSLSLTFSTIPVLFAAQIAKKDSTSNLEKKHAYYTKHLEEWIDLDIKERTTLFNAFFKASLPPIYAWVDYDQDRIALTPDLCDQMYQAPEKYSHSQLSWYLLYTQYISKTLFLHCIKHRIPLTALPWIDQDEPKVKTALQELFKHEPIYYYQDNTLFEALKPSDLPTLEKLVSDLTPEKITTMPPHLVQVWHKIIDAHDHLEIPPRLQFPFFRSFSERNLDTYRLDIDQLEKSLFADPDHYSDKDIEFYFNKIHRDHEFQVTITNISFLTYAHAQGIPLPPFTVREIPEETSKEAGQLKDLFAAYPHYYYLTYFLDESWLNSLEIPSPTKLLEKETSETVRSMPDRMIPVWYLIIKSLDPEKEEVTPPCKKVVSALIARFIKGNAYPFDISNIVLEWIDPVDLEFLTPEDITNGDNRKEWCQKIFFKKVPFDHFHNKLDEETVRLATIARKLQSEYRPLIPDLFQFDEQKCGHLPPKVREAVPTNPQDNNVYRIEDFAKALKERLSHHPYSAYTIESDCTEEEEYFLREQFPELLLPLTNRYVKALNEKRKADLPQIIEKFSEGPQHRYYGFLELNAENQTALREAFEDQAHLLPYPFNKEFIAQAKDDAQLQDQIVAQCKALPEKEYEIHFNFRWLRSKEDKTWIVELLKKNSVTVPRSFGWDETD